MAFYLDDPDYNPRFGANGRVREGDFSIYGKSWEYRNPYNQRLIEKQNRGDRHKTNINEHAQPASNPLYDYGYGRVRDAAAALKIGNVNSKKEVDQILEYLRKPQSSTQETTAPVEEPQQTGFTPTYLDTGSDFISRFGGDPQTAASGLASVQRAEAAGLSIGEIQRMASEQGISFGPKAQEYLQGKQQQGPNIEELFASQISSMQEMFQQSIQQQQQQYMEMQEAQNERMAALQQQMQQAMIAQQSRPAVAGVKMAEGTGGTPMQIARRGVTGAFGRRGMRISSLNV